MEMVFKVIRLDEFISGGSVYRDERFEDRVLEGLEGVEDREDGF